MDYTLYREEVNMSLQRITFDTREDWLAGRTEQGIGGSEAAAAIGLSPWQSQLDLWRLKSRQAQPKDLSENAAVQQGVKWEPILRDLFRKTHDEYIVEHHPYDILFQSERPWLFATLDGEIVERATNRKGILEIKTATPSGKAGWEKWNNGNMPIHYLVQCEHQLLATGYDFVRLFACLFSLDGSCTIRTYEIEQEDVVEDMTWLLQKETEFYGYVQRGIMPPMTLAL